MIFQRPISRIRRASEEAPYSLENARIMPIGVVRALKGWQAIPPQRSASLYTDKPWIRWDDDVLGENTALDDFISYEVHGGRLYASDVANKRFTIYSYDYSSSGERVTEPPFIKSVSVKKQEVGITVNEEDARGITVGACVTYIFIPYNEHNEAGRWFWYSYTAHDLAAENNFTRTSLYASGSGSELSMLTLEDELFQYVHKNDNESVVPVYEVVSNSHTAYVEVYRTSERFLDLVLLAGPHLQGIQKAAEEGGSDNQFYYLGRFNLSEPDVSGERRSEVSDAQFIPNPRSLYDPTLKAKYYDDAGNLFSLPRLTRGLNVMAQEIQYASSNGATDVAMSDTSRTVAVKADSVPKTAYAQALHNDAGVMMSGGVTWPTNYPVAAILWREPRSGGTAFKVAAQYEYKTAKGDIIFGPVTYFGSVYKLEIPWQGEHALRLYVEVDGIYREFQRLIPNEVGRYIQSVGNKERFTWTGLWEHAGTISSNLTFDAEIYNDLDSGEKAQGAEPRPHEDYIHEPTVALLSHQDRPMEVTFDYFFVRAGREILALTPARLAEEEALKSYRFYVFTESSIYTGQRNGREVFLDPVSNTVGIKTREVTTPNGTKRIPIWANTRYGVVFAGSDGRCYHLIGRRLNEGDLTVAVPGLWGEIHDVAYDPVEDEIYLLTDTGTWIYSFLQDGFVAQYPGFGTTSSTFKWIGFDEEEGCIVARLGDGSGNVALNEKGVRLHSKLVTQMLDDETDSVKLYDIRVDIDDGVKSERYDISGGDVTQVLLDTPLNGHGFQEHDEGGLILLANGNIGGDHLISTITQVDSSTSATIEDAGAPINNSVAIWPLAKITHTIRSPRPNSHEYHIYAKRKAHSPLIGSGHQLTIEGFRELRELDFKIE